MLSCLFLVLFLEITGVVMNQSGRKRFLRRIKWFFLPEDDRQLLQNIERETEEVMKNEKLDKTLKLAYQKIQEKDNQGGNK